jgi:pimeloyl-ACP methyl ester carboxylesterase
VIRYDQRDTGRATTHPPGEPPYTLRDLAADAIGVLDVLGIEHAHVVGISLGGMVAQLVALDEPGRVASLTLVATSPGGPDLPSPALSTLMALADVESPDWTDRASVVEHLVATARPLSRAFDEHARRRLAGREFDRAGPAIESAGNHAYLDHGTSWRWRLRRIAAPTLVIHGAEDPIHPVAHAHALTSEIPGATALILDQAGHELPRADWPDVLAALLRHTSGTEGGTRATSPV